MKPRTGRDLVWEKQESDTFKGRYIYLNITLIENASLYFFAGCPVMAKSCNTSSSVPDENNILGIENTFTYSECGGRLFCIVNALMLYE